MEKEWSSVLEHLLIRSGSLQLIIALRVRNQSMDGIHLDWMESPSMDGYLTLSYCVRYQTHITVYAGQTYSQNLYYLNQPPRSQYEVLEVISHPKAKDSSEYFHVNDIALIKV